MGALVGASDGPLVGGVEDGAYVGDRDGGIGARVGY